MGFVDKQIVCIKCGATFTDTAAAQDRRAAKGKTWEPKRCPKCRQAMRRRKSEIERG